MMPAVASHFPTPAPLHAMSPLDVLQRLGLDRRDATRLNQRHEAAVRQAFLGPNASLDFEKDSAGEWSVVSTMEDAIPPLTQDMVALLIDLVHEIPAEHTTKLNYLLSAVVPLNPDPGICKPLNEAIEKNARALSCDTSSNDVETDAEDSSDSDASADGLGAPMRDSAPPVQGLAQDPDVLLEALASAIDITQHFATPMQSVVPEQEALNQAIQEDDGLKLAAALKAAPLVNLALNEGELPLALAMGNGKWNAVDVLLSHPGIDPNARDPNGWTVLHLAAHHGWSKGVDKLLAHPLTEVDATMPWGSTPFTEAIANNQLAMAKKLLDKGADIHRAHGDTRARPLLTACKNGAYDTVAWLMQQPQHKVRDGKGVSVPAHLRDTDNTGRSPLSVVIPLQEFRLAALFLHQKGVDPNMRENGTPLLHLACAAGRDATLALLLRHPALRVNETDAQGRTALFACFDKFQPGNEALVERLLQHGADICKTTPAGVSILQAAASWGSLSVVTRLWQCLEERGADPRARDAMGNTALHSAVFGGQVATANYLLPLFNHNANLLAQGVSLLELALKLQHQAMAQMLLTKGANRHHVGVDGCSLLVTVCCTGNASLVRWWLQEIRSASTVAEPAVLNQTTTAHGMTPLAIAVSAGFAEVVVALLETPGVNPNLPSADGLLPLQRAALAGRMDILAALLDHPKIDVWAPGLDRSLLAHSIASSDDPLPGLAVLRARMLRKQLPADTLERMCNTPDAWNFFPVSLAIERGHPPAVVDAFKPTVVAITIHHTFTHKEKGWMITGPDLPNWKGEALVNDARQHNVELLPHGDGKTPLSGADLRKLALQSGDFGLSQFHSAWNETLRRVTVELGNNRSAPLTGVLRKLYKDGVKDVMVTGCQVGLVAHAWLRLVQQDPTMPKPQTAEHGHPDFSYTFLGGNGDSLIDQNMSDAEAWVAHCILKRTNPSAPSPFLAQVVQPFSEVRWLSDKGRFGLTEVPLLQVEQIPKDAVDATRMKERLLLWHAGAGNLSAVEHLVIAHGVNPNARQTNGFSAFLLACGAKREDVAIFLLKQGVDLSQAGTNGFSPLCTASEYGCVQVIRHLLEQGVGVNPQGNDANPLIRASAKGHLEAVQCLLAAGAQPTMKDSQQMTAIDHARIYGHHAVMHALSTN